MCSPLNELQAALTLIMSLGNNKGPNVSTRTPGARGRVNPAGTLVHVCAVWNKSWKHRYRVLYIYAWKSPPADGTVVHVWAICTMQVSDDFEGVSADSMRMVGL